ncbi:hypothetical protein VP01_2137g1, partial [Puccinia sorghi]
GYWCGLEVFGGLEAIGGLEAVGGGWRPLAGPGDHQWGLETGNGAWRQLVVARGHEKGITNQLQEAIKITYRNKNNQLLKNIITSNKNHNKQRDNHHPVTQSHLSIQHQTTDSKKKNKKNTHRRFRPTDRNLPFFEPPNHHAPQHSLEELLPERQKNLHQMAKNYERLQKIEHKFYWLISRKHFKIKDSLLKPNGVQNQLRIKFWNTVSNH